jgi:hypothetical protein
VIRFAVARKILIRMYYEMKRMQDFTIEDNVQALEGVKVMPSLKKAIEEWKEMEVCA